MQLAEKRIIYSSRSDEYRLYCIGDMHLGTKHCREKQIESRIKHIANDPLALWVDMGDAVEAITPSDKRWDAKVVSDWCHQDNIAEDQKQRYVEIVKSAKGKCLGKLTGNHEEEMRKRGHADIQKNICKTLDISDLGYTCFYRLLFQRGEHGPVFEVKCVFTHGAGCAVTKGAKINRLERFMLRFDAQIFAYGHVHDVITTTIPVLTLTKQDKILSENKCGAMTGCWFSTYTQDVGSSYGEQKDYPANCLGNALFTIRPDERHITVMPQLSD